MAEIVWGLATSHVPAIGAALDRGLTREEYWQPLFEAYRPAQEWLARHTPDVAVVVYNDHANGLGPQLTPTFGLGTAEVYPVADEGFGRRGVPEVLGHPALSHHLAEHLIADGFDLTWFHELDVDHGLTVPLSVWTPEPGDAWPCPVVPLLVNVVLSPQPSAARCYALGQALGRAIASFDGVRTVGVLGTGGMSHQLAGRRAGLINPEFDRWFLDTVETDPRQLAALRRDELVERAGTEGAELIMWLVMRGALRETVRRVHRVYHVPVSNTAAGLVLFDNRPR